jgi:oxygen-independent coproporphyrinogen-3 oxidase
MQLYIDNKTEYLNNYYFQTLCLLYYPGEKFPAESDSSNRADFCLWEENDVLFAKVKLYAAGREADGFFSAGCEIINGGSKDIAAEAVVGNAYISAGKKLFGFLPQWGSITGLRPVKRAGYYLSRGYDSEYIFDLFSKAYNVSEEKTRLSIDIAKREAKLLEGREDNSCCLYVAIPFCPTRCAYCSFVSYSNAKLFKTIPDYLIRLKEDIDRTGKIIKELGLKLTHLYIGGGTPTTLSANDLEGLLSHMESSLDYSDLTEFTVEAGRADCTTLEKLKIIKAHGVHRISINPQTTNDEVLKLIGRNHTAKQFFEAAENAFSLGFNSINADLIAGLPGDTQESFNKSLSDVISMGFDNITLHTLSVKNASHIRFGIDGVYDPLGAQVRENVANAMKTLQSCGFQPYYLYRQKNTVGNGENTGYAKEGKECLYNILMMEEHSTVFACGASAITKLVSPDKSKIVRKAFPKYPFEYLAAPKGIGEDFIRDFYEEIRNDRQS